jgi:hypothetical protein
MQVANGQDQQDLHHAPSWCVFFPFPAFLPLLLPSGPGSDKVRCAGDHINGLPGLLCTISAGEGSVMPGQDDPRIEEAKEVVRFLPFFPFSLSLFSPFF